MWGTCGLWPQDDEYYVSTDDTLPSKHTAMNQCWVNVGPVSQTVAQHQPSIGSMYCICCVSRWYLSSIMSNSHTSILKMKILAQTLVLLRGALSGGGGTILLMKNRHLSVWIINLASATNCFISFIPIRFYSWWLSWAPCRYTCWCWWPVAWTVVICRVWRLWTSDSAV